MLVVRLPAVVTAESPLIFKEWAGRLVRFAAIVALATGDICPFRAYSLSLDLDGWTVWIVSDGWIYHTPILRCVKLTCQERMTHLELVFQTVTSGFWAACPFCGAYLPCSVNRSRMSRKRTFNPSSSSESSSMRATRS